MLYFDNNATTQIDERALSVLCEISKESYGNASSIYPYGMKSKKIILEARKQIATLFNAPSENIIFTSSATESNNAVINASVVACLEKKHIITTSVEHPSVLRPLDELKRHGYEIDLLSVDSVGRIDLVELQGKLRKDTLLVSIMLVNNEIGNIYPVKKAVEVVKKINSEILFHTDAVQAIGKIKVDVKELGVDFLSFSGHKFHAPKGVGGIYIKNPGRFTPHIFGGDQEFGLRSGTENVPSIAAIGRAAELVDLQEEPERLSNMRDKIERAVLTKFAGTKVIGDIDDRACNTTNLLIPNVNGVTLVASLGELGVCVSSGSACSSNDKNRSHVLIAMGIDGKSIRISLSRLNSHEDTKRFIFILLQTIEKIQRRK